jgi:hypothetical protein
MRETANEWLELWDRVILLEGAKEALNPNTLRQQHFLSNTPCSLFTPWIPESQHLSALGRTREDDGISQGSRGCSYTPTISVQQQSPLFFPTVWLTI